MKNHFYSLIVMSFLFVSDAAKACNIEDVDSAESNLRIVLGEENQQFKNASTIEAFSILLNIEQRSPGLLQGKCDFRFEWNQYKEVQSLFQKVKSKYNMFYR